MWDLLNPDRHCFHGSKDLVQWVLHGNPAVWLLDSCLSRLSSLRLPIRACGECKRSRRGRMEERPSSPTAYCQQMLYMLYIQISCFVNFGYVRSWETHSNGGVYPLLFWSSMIGRDRARGMKMYIMACNSAKLGGFKADSCQGGLG
ncbi:hypothetical protein F5Y06DRAFT_186405 [Hypoxylon sp. FL0890]|nr:hypothetical protein F5Y06DRAFT_186405 [Hypoxylon sp. FL0890]